MNKGDAIEAAEVIFRETEEFGGEHKVRATALFDMITELDENQFRKFIELCRYLRTLQLGTYNKLLAEALRWVAIK